MNTAYLQDRVCPKSTLPKWSFRARTTLQHMGIFSHAFHHSLAGTFFLFPLHQLLPLNQSLVLRPLPPRILPFRLLGPHQYEFPHTSGDQESLPDASLRCLCAPLLRFYLFVPFNTRNLSRPAFLHISGVGLSPQQSIVRRKPPFLHRNV